VIGQPILYGISGIAPVHAERMNPQLLMKKRGKVPYPKLSGKTIQKKMHVRQKLPFPIPSLLNV
jgi:hypothetical protein